MESRRVLQDVRIEKNDPMRSDLRHIAIVAESDVNRSTPARVRPRWRNEAHCQRHVFSPRRQVASARAYNVAGLPKASRMLTARKTASAACRHKLKSRLWERIIHRPGNDQKRLVINRTLNRFEGFLPSSKHVQLAKCSTDTSLRDIKELLELGILRANLGGLICC